MLSPLRQEVLMASNIAPTQLGTIAIIGGTRRQGKATHTGTPKMAATSSSDRSEERAAESAAATAERLGIFGSVRRAALPTAVAPT